MQLDSSKRSTAGTWRCLVCGDEVRAEGSVCSRACVLEARRELDENVAAIRQQRDDATDGRAELIARNGLLTAAMISWSP